MRLTGSLVLLAAWSALGCAPLTFSEPGRIDFASYRSVAVTVTAPEATDPSGYLADELRAISGFELVTTNPADHVDLLLNVVVTTTTQSAGTDTRWDSSAEFTATTPAGSSVYSGNESDDSTSAERAIQDALDKVALDFIKPFRL